MYDVKKYTKPFWEGNIVYNEVVYPINDKGTITYYYDLMYEPTEIISVKDYRLEVEYKKGVDYHIVGGNIFIPGTSAISKVDYSYIHPSKAPDGYGADQFSPYYPHADGNGYEYWVGGSDICNKAIVVTYIHNGTWNGPVPERQESRLPSTMEKLKNREDMTIVVAGDSVSTGAMASGFLGISPFADAYPEMTVKALREKFGYDGIKLVNSAIGGTMSYFEETKMNNTIIRHSPDLVILNFGMNDSSCDRVGIPGKEFHDNLALQIEYIKKNLPECEILLVSSLYGNRYTFPEERYEEHAAVLYDLVKEYEGVGVADPQRIHKYLMDEIGKDYLCFFADNMVHPGDFGMRLMAQCILEALDVSDVDSYKETLFGSLAKKASPEDHVDDGKKDELSDVLLELERELKLLDDEWDINAAVNKAADTINFILNRCDFEDHVFSHVLLDPTCKDIGYVHSTCTVCGFEYNHSFSKALGGEHAFDEGRQTKSPTYVSDGVYTYSCAKCGFEDNRSIPMLSDPPVMNYNGMLHVNKSYNYMECRYKPYTEGSGFIEMDVCPLDIDVESTPYIGVWFSGYSITACYNFRLQQVEIISTTLPYAGGTPYAYKKVPWTPDNGKFEYNWKKFAVNVEGNTVRIYLNGELVLEDTNELYRASSEVALAYSVGEFYLDNIKVAGKGYDPVTGEGKYLTFCDFDSNDSMSQFRSAWSNSYSELTRVNPTAKSITTGKYKVHKHTLSYINTVDRTCSGEGYREFFCSGCGEIIRVDVKPPLYEDGHALIDKHVMEAPTDIYAGRYGYSCENCFTTFTEKIPVGCNYFPVLMGDINSDGNVNYIDTTYMSRILSGADIDFELPVIDFNNDGLLTLNDETLMMRRYAS